MLKMCSTVHIWTWTTSFCDDLDVTQTQALGTLDRTETWSVATQIQRMPTIVVLSFWQNLSLKRGPWSQNEACQKSSFVQSWPGVSVQLRRSTWQKILDHPSLTLNSAGAAACSRQAAEATTCSAPVCRLGLSRSPAGQWKKKPDSAAILAPTRDHEAFNGLHLWTLPAQHGANRDGLFVQLTALQAVVTLKKKKKKAIMLS